MEARICFKHRLGVTVGIPSLVVVLGVAIEDTNEVVYLIVPARIPNQSSAFLDDKLHSSIVIFGELDCFWIRGKLCSGDQKAICKVVVGSWPGTIWSPEDGFDGTVVSQYAVARRLRNHRDTDKRAK